MNCKNCNDLINEKDNYCASCGGKVIRNRLTIKNLLEHFSEQFLNYDNKFLQTFIHLFTKPEVVIDGYINGTRKKYVDAISYFAIAITLSGLQLFILNKFFPGVMDFSAISRKETEEFNRQTMSFLQEYQSIVMMFYIPLYALMSKITFLKIKKYNYTEHLVIFMYIQAQISIISLFYTVGLLILGVPFIVLSYLIIPLMIVYSAFCLKRLYGLNFQEIILRTLIFLIILGVFMVILTIIMTGAIFLMGGFDEMIEAKKAAKEALGN